MYNYSFPTNPYLQYLLSLLLRLLRVFYNRGPQPLSQYWSVACWEPGHTAGDEKTANKERFIYIYIHSPLLALQPEFYLPPSLWKNCFP